MHMAGERGSTWQEGCGGGHGPPGTALGLGGDAERWREGSAAGVVPPRGMVVSGRGLNCTQKCRALMVKGELH